MLCNSQADTIPTIFREVLMSISPEVFRDTLRYFSAGVTIISVKTGDRLHGLTATGFVTISQTPPLIAIVIDHRGRAYEMLEQPETVFSVSILRNEHEALANRFATSKEDRYLEGKWTTAVTGAPVLEDALAWLDCTVSNRIPMGTNSVYIGEVQVSYTNPSPEARPLVYWNRAYHVLES